MTDKEITAELERLNNIEKDLEKRLLDVREHRREIINRHNLNKREKDNGK